MVLEYYYGHLKFDQSESDIAPEPSHNGLFTVTGLLAEKPNPGRCDQCSSVVSLKLIT